MSPCTKQADPLQARMEELAMKVAARTADEVVRRLNLDNRTGDSPGISEGDDDMSRRLREKVTVNGLDRWITGGTMQQLLDNYVQVLVNEGLLEWNTYCTAAPLLKDYIQSFYSTFKQNQVETTIINRERIIRNHILPRFGNTRINAITSTDCQKWFNDLNKKYAKDL